MQESREFKQILQKKNLVASECTFINSICHMILKFIEIVAFGRYSIYEKAFIESGYRKNILQNLS